MFKTAEGLGTTQEIRDAFVRLYWQIDVGRIQPERFNMDMLSGANLWDDGCGAPACLLGWAFPNFRKRRQIVGELYGPLYSLCFNYPGKGSNSITLKQAQQALFLTLTTASQIPWRDWE